MATRQFMPQYTLGHYADCHYADASQYRRATVTAGCRHAVIFATVLMVHALRRSTTLLPH